MLLVDIADGDDIFLGNAREMLLRPIGRTVYWMPPYCLKPDEMEILASRTMEIVACA